VVDSLQALRTLGSAPVLHSTLVSMLRDYKNPNNKIAPEREAGRHPFSGRSFFARYGLLNISLSSWIG